MHLFWSKKGEEIAEHVQDVNELNIKQKKTDKDTEEDISVDRIAEAWWL